MAALLIAAMLGLAAGFGTFVYQTVAQVRQALAGEVLEQQNSIAALMQNYSAVILALERQRLAPGERHRRQAAAAAQTALDHLLAMRQRYSFTRLDGVATSHAYVKPVLEDVIAWLRAGVPGYAGDHPTVAGVALQRVAERHPDLMEIAADARVSADALIAEQTRHLGWFRNTAFGLLAGFTLLALTTAALLIYQRNLQTRLAWQRQRHNEQIRCSKQRFMDFADSAADWFWETDADGRLVYLSDGYRRIAGEPVSAVVGSRYDALFPRLRASRRDWRRYLSALRTRQPFRNIEFQWRRPDGGIRTVSLSGRPVYGSAGTGAAAFLGYRGVGRDISARRGAELALIAEKERLRVTLASIGEAVITTDAGGRIEYFNPAAETLTGRSSDETRGRPAAEVLQIVDEHSREPVDPVAGCLRVNHPAGVPDRVVDQAVLIGRDGREYAVQDTISPIRGRDGAALGSVLVLRDVSDARRQARQAAHQAAHDPLTGLVNRREFERRLDQALRASRERRTEHALCYLDLDQFKIVNDTCGHAAGDELLRQIAALFRRQLRSRDTLARLGGDEFAVLMQHCSTQQAVRAANQLRRAVEEFRFGWNDKSFALGVSIGLAPVDASVESVDAALRAADSACYVAKEAGRNRLHIYRENDAELARRHGEMQWVTRLQQALEQQRFQLHAQPIVALDGRAAATGLHVELLLRLEAEDGRLVLPGAFLPAAERYHLMPRLDRWVIDTALRRLAAHPEQLRRIALCSINLSGHSLSDETLLEFIGVRFDELAVPPEKICFEVTETAAITHLVSATRFMSALKRRGCRFALDDFGSGLSSFGYLKNLPVDFVKIDGLFVRDVADDPVGFAMVRAINEIGQLMGKRTVAEYVEDRQVLDKLHEIGVDYAQGYITGRPQPIAELLDQMARAPDAQRLSA